MLQNKKVKMAVALIASLCLWAYVTGTVDPTVTEKFTGVTIQIVNEKSLIQEDLAIESLSNDTIDLTLSGSRADISKLQKSDITVSVDMYGRHKGNNYVSVDVQVPKGITVDSKSLDRVEVEIGQLVTAEKEVEATVKGTLPESMTLGETTINPETVMVYGTQSNVDKVDYLQATLDADQLSTESSTQEAEITPVDKDGNTVSYVTTSRSKVDVTAVLAKYKKVNLNVDTTGSVDSQYEVTSMTSPDSIYIVGSVNILKNIETIETKPIDLSNITESTKVKIEPILPDGVTLKNPDEKLYLEITIKEPESITYKYDGSDITINNLEDGFAGTISDTVTLNITGQKTVLSSLKKEDIKLSVDASDLEAGTYDLKLNINYGSKDIVVSPSSENVAVTIRKE